MNIFDLLQKDGFNPKRQASTNGGEFAGPCPWCAGNDRFRVWPETDRYWCRICGRAGDSIQYLRDFHHLSFQEACQVIGREPKTEIGQQRQTRPVWEPKIHSMPNEQWQDTMINFITWAANQLFYHPVCDGMKFLKNERLLSEDTVAQAMIGINPSDLNVPREKLGLPDYERETVWLPAGIVIPYSNGEGLHRVRIRRWNGEPRYFFAPGGSATSMIVPGNPEAIVIVESELDAILIGQVAGDLCQAVALGNAQTRPDSKACEAIQRAKTVLVALDGDEAGAKSFWQWWSEHFPKAKRWPVVGGKDPTEAAKNGLNLRDWILAGCLQ